MSLADALKDDLFAFLARGEVIARDSVPSEAPVHSESSGFTLSKQRGVFRGQGAGPAIRTLVANIAQDGEVRISTARKAYFGRSTRVATATAREHSCKGLLL